jgi:Xaa-Pro dipeptidase
MLDLERAQNYMRESAIDGWLVYDFRGHNPVMAQVAGAGKFVTRRNFLFIPRDGKIGVIAHFIDRDQFANLDAVIQSYAGWPEMIDHLRQTLTGSHRIAMEYSPGGAIPAMAWVDGGTLELIRSLGVEVVSSADLFQIAATTWPKAALDSHMSASQAVAAIKDAAFDYIRRSLAADRSLTEYDVQEFIMREFREQGLETEHRPIVAVNANSGNPHYEPTQQRHLPIAKGDWVLIDLWARHPGEQNVFADITWVAYAGDRVPENYEAVFEIVKIARDRVVARLKEAWASGEKLQGWQVDMVARATMDEAGYAQDFKHRTGHSMGPGTSVHALGVNLDNLETHDTRSILPGIGFSVEPGIYLAEFGVRSEINMFVDPDDGPTVTTPLQEEIIRLI